jgi:hypothetical protein
VSVTVALVWTLPLGAAAPRVQRRLPHPPAAITLWAPSPGVKVQPADSPVFTSVATVKGARNETVSLQIVLTAQTAMTGVDVRLSALSGPGGAEIAAASTQLYRVGYLYITHPSDRAGAAGEWPDTLYPIGRDRFWGEPRNGAPFDLAAGRNQPVWVSVDIPKTAPAGLWTGTFSVLLAPGGGVLATMPVQLLVWNFTLPDVPSARTTYGFDTYQTYLYHYCPTTGCWDTDQIKELTRLYWQEALAHRITLDGTVAGVPYTYHAATGTVTDIDWSWYDAVYTLPGVTTYPIPGPQFDWNDSGHAWTPAETAEAIAFFKAVGARFAQNGWSDRAFLYTQDEPHEAWPLNVVQSNALASAEPGLRALVTSEYTADLATGHIGIWCPIVNSLDEAGGISRYEGERAAGKKIWWYDSDSSGDSDNLTYSRFGIWPDEFIDHQGANQLVHAAMQWKYNLDGYLYYAVTECYRSSNPDVWATNDCFGRNGDGTLFYPGRPSIIGGSHDIPVPSLRLELLRMSWNEYDYMTLLAAAGQRSFVDGVVAGLVTRSDTWSHDAADYDAAREQLGARLDALHH